MGIVDKKVKGFTIVELIVIIGVIGILAGITVVGYGAWRTTTTQNQLKSDLNSVASSMESARNFSNTYPASVPATFTPSSGVTLAGGAKSGGNSFCVSAANGGQTYHVSQYNIVSVGICPDLEVDAGISASYSGTGTNWTDLSGNGNNGTLVNGVAYNSANKGSLVFDGANDYVTLPAGLQSKVYSEVSVSAWFKIPNGVQQFEAWGGYIVHNSVDTTVGNSIYALAANKAGNIVWSWAGNYASMTTTSLYNDGNWHYLVGTWNGVASTMYIDGSQVKTSATAANTTGTAGTLTIGGTSLNPVFRPFNGSVSNVSILDKALSPDDINQNFNALRGRYGI